ncbi:MAG: ankyrin repeat domain-containing protein [Acidobacteriota bacterium]
MTIFDAIEQVDMGRIWQLATRGNELESLDEETQLTPLALAAELGHTEIVRLLVEAGADPDIGGATSPLEAAVLEGKPELVEILISAGANVNQRVAEGFTPLMTAAVAGYEDIASMLLRAGGRPRARNEDGYTAIDLAMAEGHGDLARVLRTFSRRGQKQQLAREKAMRAEREEEIRLRREERRRQREDERRAELVAQQQEALRQAQENQEAQGPESPTSPPSGDPLAAAAAFFDDLDDVASSSDDSRAMEGVAKLDRLLADGEHESARAMLESKEVGKEDRDPQGRTPLMVAATWGDLGLTEWLLEAGVEVDAVDDSEGRETALLKAINHPTPRRLQIIERLAAAGADLERRHGPNAMTPLMSAATADVYIDNPHSHIFGTTTRLLVELGAELEAKDERGNTVWRLIKRNAMGALTSSPHRRALHQMLKVLEHSGAEQLASHLV